MARKNKLSVDYFPHYVSHGSKMNYMRSQYGNDGYAVWFMIMEKLGSQNLHYYRLDKSMTLKFMASECKVDENTFLAIIETLVEFNWLDAELWRDFRVIYSQEFVESLSHLYVRRNADLPHINDIYVDINEINVYNNRINVDRSTQSKVKQSKVKKNKYAEYVNLSDTEYTKLTEKLGEKLTAEYIDKLNNYIGSKGKRYKSHYHTILTWHSKDKPAEKSTYSRPKNILNVR